jgi:hypothetical protein
MEKCVVGYLKRRKNRAQALAAALAMQFRGEWRDCLEGPLFFDGCVELIEAD